MKREPRVWLVNLRNSKSITQQQLADEAAISRNYLSELESGSRNPSVPVAKRICEVLGCDWTFFYADDSRVSQH